ncbi:hypothetical protein HN615_03610 [Candidatus Woesearchaeota archaeon]|nr:hypothetical protein [Candidatus Woesearchaeota archaeon]
MYTGKCEQQGMFRAGTPILGGSGTIFCGDTTGYHTASVVGEGERLVMVISFAEARINPCYFK